MSVATNACRVIITLLCSSPFASSEDALLGPLAPTVDEALHPSHQPPNAPSKPVTEWPLVTVTVLTCNRPQYALLALRQIAAQDYRGPLEVLVVDDGSVHIEPLLRAEHPNLQVVRYNSSSSLLQTPNDGIPARPTSSDAVVRLVALSRRATIGAKRSLAVRLASGGVAVHWDDDDFHDPRRISAQVAPIARGDADVTALQLTHYLAMPSFDVYEILPSGPFFGDILWATLAYRPSIGRDYAFANVSLAEDVDFAERVVAGCHRFDVVKGVTSLYTRHEGTGLSNTWRFNLQERVRQQQVRAAARPRWLSPELAELAAEAEADSAERACPVIEAHRPESWDPEASTLPYMPPHCCSSPADEGCLQPGDAKKRRRQLQYSYRQATSRGRHFVVQFGASLELEGFRLINGYAKSAGGSILAHDGAKVHLRDTAIEDCKVEGDDDVDDGHARGGAIAMLPNADSLQANVGTDGLSAACTQDHVLATGYGHTDEVLAVAWSPDGSRIVSGSKDGNISVWDAANVSLGPLLSHQGHTDAVNSISFSPDGSRFVSGSSDNSTKVWNVSDVAAGPLSVSADDYEEMVFAVAWSPNGSLILTGRRSDERVNELNSWGRVGGRTSTLRGKDVLKLYDANNLEAGAIQTHTAKKTSDVSSVAWCVRPHAHQQTHRHTDTQTHGHTDTQTHRHTDTQTHRHTDTHRQTEHWPPHCGRSPTTLSQSRPGRLTARNSPLSATGRTALSSFGMLRLDQSLRKPRSRLVLEIGVKHRSPNTKWETWARSILGIHVLPPPIGRRQCRACPNVAHVPATSPTHPQISATTRRISIVRTMSW